VASPSRSNEIELNATAFGTTAGTANANIIIGAILVTSVSSNATDVNCSFAYIIQEFILSFEKS
jgi:hypothetical protein